MCQTVIYIRLNNLFHRIRFYSLKKRQYNVLSILAINEDKYAFGLEKERREP